MSERHFNKASVTNVDAIQSLNIPIVDSDSGYASMLDASYMEPQLEEYVHHQAASLQKTTEPRQEAASRQKTTKPRHHEPVQERQPRNKRAKTAPRRDAHTDSHELKRPKVRRKRTVSAQRSLAVQPIRATGVGSITHRFPPTLKNYVTFFKRPSSRRAPTDRYGTSHSRQGEAEAA